MFSLSVFSTILLIIAACGAIVIFVFSIRSFLAKRSGDRFNKDNNSSGLAFHLGTENDEIVTESTSVFREIPGRLWEDLKHNLNKIFSKKPVDDETEAKYDNAEEHDMLARIREEEGFDEYSMPAGIKDSDSDRNSGNIDNNTVPENIPEGGSDITETATDEEGSENIAVKVETENISAASGSEDNNRITRETADNTKQDNNSVHENQSDTSEVNRQAETNGSEDMSETVQDTKKTKNVSVRKKKKIQEPDDLSYLFSIPDREESPVIAEEHSESVEEKHKAVTSADNDKKLNELRKNFLERKKNRKRTIHGKRKEQETGQPLSEEDQIFASSMLEDLLDDCDNLDKNKIKGRISFLHSTLKKK
ncbi:MAG: hypothetical protein J6Z08_01685 [Elusimicrobiales bacterium]|nr:hypothetical protein [Elusimicrobiales bacterium]